MHDCHYICSMEEHSSTAAHDHGTDHLSRGDRDSLSSCSGDDVCSAFPSAHRVWEWCLDWKKLVWKKSSVGTWIWINVITFLGVLLGDIIICEASTSSIRDHRHATAIFPICIPNAVAFAFACKWEGSAAIANLGGFFAGKIYISARNGSDLLGVKLLFLFILSFIEMMEAQIGADLLRRSVCRGKALPTLDSVHDAVLFSTVSFGVSLSFETAEVIFRCIMGLTEWSSFARLWSTKWLSVMAAFITVAPALIHGFAYVPKYSRLLRPRKVFEFTLLIFCSVAMLGLVIFSLPFTSVIRPLPYLLYPLLIFSVFRFNRLGWTVVVAAIAIFGSWGSLHFKSSALYYTSGSSRRSSPMLIVQVELFMAVLGLVAIMLAGAVREKKQLTRDLHNMNQKLEEAVSKRTEELIKANTELKVSQARAEKANLAKSDFLANMSHEIRTPIHGILGLTALLLQSELSPDQLENLLSVKDCADLLLHIINSILDLAKIEAGRLEVETVPFSIRKIVSGTLRMLQLRAKERGLRLLWKVDGDVPPTISGDPGKIQQCILNLVGNALKFTHSGSVRVHISLGTGFESTFSHVLSVRRKESIKKSPGKSPSFPARLRSWASWPSSEIVEDLDEDNVKTSLIDMFSTRLTRGFISTMGSTSGLHVSTRSTDRSNAERVDSGLEYVLIEVSDTGIGISKDSVREMFNPFTQADASTSRLYGGTGLGLSIVHRFVELLGGKIWVESEIGKGSMFSFVVPFRRVSENQGKTGGNSPSPVRVSRNPSISAERPPRAEKKTPLGKDRRAQSLNALMKNLKFTTSPYSDVEPLIQTGAKHNSGDSRLKQPSLQEFTEVDDGEGPVRVDNVVTDRESGSGRSSVTDTVIAQTLTAVAALSQASDVDKECESRGSSAAAAEGQLLATVLEGRNFSENDESTKSLRNGTSLRKDTKGAHDDESSSSTSEQMRRGRDGYRDLELGISDSRLPHGSSGISKDGSRIDSMGDEPSAAITHADSQLSSEEASEPTKRVAYAEQQPGPRKPRKGNLHVLLAEDNMINQRVATRQLQKHGHMVTIVGDGLQALNTVRSHHDKFDLVLMDIQMPNMDGLQATERIRAEEAERGWSRLPVLGLTAHAISGYQEICHSHGMDAYLGKPFNINQLLTTIDKFV